MPFVFETVRRIECRPGAIKRLPAFLRELAAGAS
jgi:hypothetical protein